MGIRKGIKHLHQLNADEIAAFTSGDKITGYLTEKTDGFAFGIGWDEDGWYTRTASSPKVRSSGDTYSSISYQKFGADSRNHISMVFDKVNRNLLESIDLIEFLQRQYRTHKTDVCITGEVFPLPLGKPYTGSLVGFVGTLYDMNVFGEGGLFVIHTRSPNNLMLSGDDNEWNPSQFNTMSYRFDVDSVWTHYPKFEIDCSRHNSFPPLAELTTILNKVVPKWGPQTEGYVIHPDRLGVPTVKVVDSNWAVRKNEIGAFEY